MKCMAYYVNLILKKVSCLIVLVTLLFIIIPPPASAQSPQITNGLNYLTTTQNHDGSWGNEISSVDILPATISVIETLQILKQTTSQSYSDAISWLYGQNLETTDYLSGRLHALSVAGTDLDLLLSYIDEFYTGAWGGYKDFEVNNLDTALALSALKGINHPDQNIISSALGYLLSTQNIDGGWGFYTGDESNVYMTAIASSTLQQFPQVVSIATAVRKATSYLMTHQNIDGGFGSTTTVYETALAYMALVAVTTDNTVLGGAINYLTATQSTDGSWNQDPYSTALALRALYFSQFKPSLPPPATGGGTITGTVIDAFTSQPLSGVKVALENNSIFQTTTDSTGNFTLSNVPSGDQTLIFSTSNYAPFSTGVNVIDDSLISLGTIKLSFLQE